MPSSSVQSSRSWGEAVGRAVAYDPGAVGGVAVGLMVGTSGLLGLPLDGPLLVLGFCGAALVYWGDRVLGLSPEDVHACPDRVAWVRRHRAWLRVEALVLAGSAAAMLPQVEGETLVVGAGLALVGAAHVFPIGPGGRRLKDWGHAKPVVIALIWSAGGVLLPVVEGSGADWGVVAALVVYRVGFILPNVLLADWGDRGGDAASGLTTWATQTSTATLRRRAALLAGIAAAGALAAVAGSVVSWIWAVDALGPLAMAAAVLHLRPDARPGHMGAADLLVAWPAVPGGLVLLMPEILG